ncbi:hypothetical protein SAMN05660350_01342 [Geodermatophilus obscurus]|uniref:Uncharacterized protein n=1 Tax=Geodermatophilus obscurus TaxID=1861 RepID=A0A1M7T6H8_9ACTN|nr:hypothetical protein [Geodermatophilus obscurus]SHN66308.1 hypothetical protein SAMN05660350_01342 [Geodermatophilus obscurus]
MALIRPLKPSVAWVAAALFGAVGVFATWVGTLDFLSAANLQYKLIGLAFTMAGLVLLAGSAVIAREPWRRKRGRIAAVAAGVAGVFVGGYLLLLQYRAPDLSPRRLPPFPAWVPWAAIVVASLAAAVLGWRSTKDHAAEQMTWTALGKPLFAGGLSVTVLFGGVQWWYTQQYQPNAIAAALTVTTELRPAPPTAGENADEMSDPHMFEGTITVKNVSSTKVQIVASLYQVRTVTNRLRDQVEGINEVDRERQQVACFLEELAPVTDPECDQPHIYRYGQLSAGDPRAEDEYPISRTSQPIAVQTLQLGHIVRDNSWLEPEEAFEHNLVVHVPGQGEPSGSPSLEELQLSAWLAVAQGSRLVLERIPSHGPEMVPQALMSHEEYRDYAQAEQDVQSSDGGAADSADSTGDGTHVTVEVDAEDREDRLQELAMSRPLDQASLAVSEPQTTPRFYPHRYTVAEWPIEDLSTLHRLVWGSHVINTVQVLSMRTYDPIARSEALEDPDLSALMEYEYGGMVTCVGPAGTLGGAADGSDIRRDPTAVCPGAWYSLADEEGRVANSYERLYQGKTKYGEDMAGFYGLVQTGSLDVVSLTTEAEAAAAATTMPPSTDFHPLPSDVFQQCEPALQDAKTLTDFYGTYIQSAFDRRVAELRGASPDGTSGAPTLQQGADSAEILDGYLERAKGALLACSGTEAPEDTPAASCPQAAAAKIDALRYAQDVGRALREAEPTDAWVQRGTQAVQAYQRAEGVVDEWLVTCR